MFRRLSSILFAVAFAAAGVIAGRLFIDLRRQVEEGEELHVDVDRIKLHPRELIPGIIAALRVHDRPWSFLHVPSWLAAFAINFGFVAFASELAPVRGILGFDLFGPDDDDRDRDEGSYASTARSETLTVREVVTEEAGPAEPAMPVWTAESAGSTDEPADAPAPGFTPLPG